MSTGISTVAESALVNGHPQVEPLPQGIESWPGWSRLQANEYVEEKEAIGFHFATHSWLVPDDTDPSSSRARSADVLVNPGTTQDEAVRKCLAWMDEHWQTDGPFSVIWYTPSTVLAGTLHDFRESHQPRRSASELFLFPGLVDADIQSPTGEDAVEFAKNQLKTRFTYSILSSYRFDLGHGFAYFHYPSEVMLQRACAELHSGHKFLLLAPNKFIKTEGQRGYSVVDLFQTTDKVTIYTFQSKHDELIEGQFNQLVKRVFSENENGPLKTLNLCIVGCNDQTARTRSESGYLIRSETD